MIIAWLCTLMRIHDMISVMFSEPYEWARSGKRGQTMRKLRLALLR